MLAQNSQSDHRFPHLQKLDSHILIKHNQKVMMYSHLSKSILIYSPYNHLDIQQEFNHHISHLAWLNHLHISDNIPMDLHHFLKHIHILLHSLYMINCNSQIHPYFHHHSTPFPLFKHPHKFQYKLKLNCYPLPNIPIQ